MGRKKKEEKKREREREVIAVMPLFDGWIVDGFLHYQLNHLSRALCVSAALCVLHCIFLFSFSPNNNSSVSVTS